MTGFLITGAMLNFLVKLLIIAVVAFDGYVELLKLVDL